jgi:hypothetical protein
MYFSPGISDEDLDAIGDELVKRSALLRLATGG